MQISSEDQKELIAEYLRTNSQLIAKKLITQYESYIHFLCKGYRSYRDYEDIVNACKLAIFENLKDYDPEKGDPSTFLYYHIKNAARYTFNYQKNMIKLPQRTHSNRDNCINTNFLISNASDIMLSFDESIDEQGRPLHDIIPDLSVVDSDNQIMIKEISKILSLLDEKEKLIIYKRYILDQPLREVGESLNLSYERVRQIEVKALSKVRKKLRIK